MGQVHQDTSLFFKEQSMTVDVEMASIVKEKKVSKRQKKFLTKGFHFIEHKNQFVDLVSLTFIYKLFIFQKWSKT